jgi:hypothetical protein
VSDFVIDHVYIGGDTIWCTEVEDAISRHHPRVTALAASLASLS